MGTISSWNKDRKEGSGKGHIGIRITAGVIVVLLFVCLFVFVILPRFKAEPGDDPETSTSDLADNASSTEDSSDVEDTTQAPTSETSTDRSEPSAGPSEEIISSDADETTGATDPADVTEAPTEPKEEYITILAVGDNLYHKSLSQSGIKEDGTYDYTPVYRAMRYLISAADIAVINQETPMAGESYGIQTYPKFNVPQQISDAMVWAGFDVVSFATNHMLDMGRQGLIDTAQYWKDKHPDVLVTGIALSQEERDTVPYVECKGKKIAFLNYTYGVNSGNLGRQPYLLNFFDEATVRADIARAKETCDYVIVLPHWGVEGRMEPTEDQYNMALILADAGADVVIGTHPHVIQKVQWVTGASGHNTLVFYSLGNFISLQDTAAKMLGGVAKLRLRIDPETGELSLDDYRMDYIVTHFTYDPEIELFSGMTAVPWDQYSRNRAAQHGLISWGKKFSYDMLETYIKNNGPVTKEDIERIP
ncbi:MAG: CapA family protein [Lachnospiraceae bacterium]|nr:CapA family protein [Lachnospiraceae bacterium]